MKNAKNTTAALVCPFSHAAINAAGDYVAPVAEVAAPATKLTAIEVSGIEVMMLGDDVSQVCRTETTEDQIMNAAATVCTTFSVKGKKRLTQAQMEDGQIVLTVVKEEGCLMLEWARVTRTEEITKSWGKVIPSKLTLATFATFEYKRGLRGMDSALKAMQIALANPFLAVLDNITYSTASQLTKNNELAKAQGFVKPDHIIIL